LKNNVRRTNPRKERLWETENNVLELVTEDGDEELKMLAQHGSSSMKMETCRIGRILQRERERERERERGEREAYVRLQSISQIVKIDGRSIAYQRSLISLSH